MDHPISLIVGLCNPGSQYENTRHNAGEWFLNAILQTYSIHLRTEKKFKGELGLLHLDHHECHLLKPSTFMNLSGESVALVANFFKILPHSILVVHDELDLPVGTVRLKKGGGHGGHNGLRSLISCLGTSDFLRLRIGIAHPGQAHLVTNYVLNRPSRDEENKIMESVQKPLSYLDKLLEGKIHAVMNELHKES